MPSTRVLTPVALMVLLLAGGCAGDPFGDLCNASLDVSPDGRYLAAVSQIGEIRVWDLATRRRSLLLPRGGAAIGREFTIRYFGAALRGNTGQLLFDCMAGTLCSLDLKTGQQVRLFEHHPQDSTRLALSSADGERIVVGTAGGLVMSWAASDRVPRTRKPRDVWTPGSSWPIYTLEGDRDLNVFFSATADVTRAQVEKWGAEHPEEGYIQFDGYRGPMWQGIVMWPFQGTGYRLIGHGFVDKVRIDIGPRRDRVAIFQEGGPGWVFRLPSMEPEFDLSPLGPPEVPGTTGVRFLDGDGSWLGEVSYFARRIAIYSVRSEGVGWERRGILRLKNDVAGGERMMVALPERRWFFLGLRDAAVDWYEFIPGNQPRISHIATLR